MDYNYLIKFTEIALNDIDNIYNYILQKNNKAISKKITDKIRLSILILRNFPKMYPIYNIMKFKGYRKLIIDNWVVIYDVNDIKKEVLIIRILSTKVIF